MGDRVLEMWLDFGCPWSRISLVELTRVLAVLDTRTNVRIHSVRLDPDAPTDYGHTTIEHLCADLNISVNQAEQMLESVVEGGARASVRFDFHRARGGSSFDAHRVLHLAHRYDKQIDLALAVFRAHFEEGLLISNHNVLHTLATDVGLPSDAVRALLTGDAYARDVLTDESTAAERGIERTPHLVINETHHLSGVQYFEDLLRTCE